MGRVAWESGLDISIFPITSAFSPPCLKQYDVLKNEHIIYYTILTLTHKNLFHQHGLGYWIICLIH